MELFKGIESIDGHPNALAHLRVDPRCMMIEVDTLAKEDDMAAKRSKKTSSESDGNVASRNEVAKESNLEVERIWKCLGMGKIDLDYACVGYSYGGRQILDHSALVDLLINYGFKVADVLQFIDEFADCGEKDDKAPMVMMSAHISRIMAEVEPLEDSK